MLWYVLWGALAAGCGRINFDPLALEAQEDAAGQEDAATDDAATTNPDCPSSLGSGRLHHCAITGGGELYCWGENTLGQIGDGTTQQKNTPTLIGSGYADVMGGRRSTCAVSDDGRRSCWGENDNGQLGIGTTTPSEVSPSQPPAESLEFLSMAHAAVHGCGLTTNKEVYCWGSNGSGRLGVNGGSSTLPVSLGLEPIDILEAGGSTSCAIASSGTFYCWGNGADGACASGDTNHCLLPTVIPSLANASATSVRDAHGCAIVAGEVFCWGTNGDGESGSIGASVLSPQLVPGSSGFVEVAMGNEHSCALHGDGRVFCWGLNSEGELGDGSTVSRHTPAPVQGITDAIELASASFSTCARLADQSVVCWGRNIEGQLGDNAAANFSALPVSAFPCP